jgi:Holliday junction resolvase-like predicted endonuclease
MHPELIARAISGMISPRTSIDEFMANSMIYSKTVARDVLHYLHLRGVGSISNGVVTFFPSDRLKTALMALQYGSDIERVSIALTWRDFEAFAVEVLKRFGYKTHLNVRFRKPRCEIDVIGIDSRHAIVIDCKHWKRSYISSIYKYAKKQLIRTQHLLQSKTTTITSAMPVLLTLHCEKVKFVNKVPVIPINALAAFLYEFDWNCQEFHIVYHD